MISQPFRCYAVVASHHALSFARLAQPGCFPTEGTVYYGVGGAFRIIEPGDSATNTDLYFHQSDHLGSTALIVDADMLDNVTTL
ncbi:MAG: hypothetical protein ACFB51_05360 [Anaerolineae bacterium]